jgi:hypothetical protein
MMLLSNQAMFRLLLLGVALGVAAAKERFTTQHWVEIVSPQNGAFDGERLVVKVGRAHWDVEVSSSGLSLPLVVDSREVRYEFELEDATRGLPSFCTEKGLGADNCEHIKRAVEQLAAQRRTKQQHDQVVMLCASLTARGGTQREFWRSCVDETAMTGLGIDLPSSLPGGGYTLAVEAVGFNGSPPPPGSPLAAKSSVNVDYHSDCGGADPPVIHTPRRGEYSAAGSSAYVILQVSWSTRASSRAGG